MKNHSKQTYANKKRRLTKFWKKHPKIQKKTTLDNFLKQLTPPHEKRKKYTSEAIDVTK